MISALIEYAKAWLGIPYVYGGNNPLSGFDCSGYILWVLSFFGMSGGDKSAQAIYDHFSKPAIGYPLQVPEPGALVFYGKNNREISHVALSFDKYFILESAGGDSKTKTKAAAEKEGACVRQRMYNYRGDLVAIVMPKYPKL